MKRLGGPAFPPENVVALVGAGLVAWQLRPAHSLFVKHNLGGWLLTCYVFFPVAWGLLWVARSWRAGHPRSRRFWFPLLACVALHQVNTRLYAGLYPKLHLALTGLTGLLALAALLLFLSQKSNRWALGATGLVAVGSLGWFLGGGSHAARVAAAFHGTELEQALTLMNKVGDRDGDGLAAWSGDCDDQNPLVHALHYEIPGNGVDDNCRAGDAVVGQPRVSRAVEPSSKVAAWRDAHPRPDIVMVFIDTLRFDHVGALGDTRGLTPHLDRFFARSVVFEQARTTAPRTPHAWMSIVRARFNGRVLRCRSRIAHPGPNTLPQRLRRAGYRTVARLVGTSWKRFHLDGGWKTLNTRKEINRISGPDVTRDALKLAKGRGPLFLVAHYTDPHAPYKRHPGEPRPKSMREAYAAEVRGTDAAVGALLDGLEALGRLEDAVVMVFADHGENLGDHGDSGGHHGVSVYDEVIRVPMAIAGPGFSPTKVSDPVSVIDLGSTLLDLLDMKPLPNADGRSLAGYLLGEPPEPSFTISEFYDFGHRLRSIVVGRHKLIVDLHHDARVLFDLEADPQERTDLFASEPEVTARLEATLGQWVDDWADPAEPDPARCVRLVPGHKAKRP